MLPVNICLLFFFGSKLICSMLKVDLYWKLIFVTAETVLLAFQHYIVMLGTTVMISSLLVPLMGGDNVRSALFLFFFFLSNKNPCFVLCKYSFKKMHQWMDSMQGDKARVIQTLLFMSGINTLLQTLLGTRLPTVMNASFAFVIPVVSIINDYRFRGFRNEHEVN